MFVSVRFRKGQPKSYDYNVPEGMTPEPRVGDDAKVPGRDGDGWQRATIVAVNPGESSRATKDILGVIPQAGQLC
jgi:hypothetical protein